MDKLFNPDSIAIIGLSNKANNIPRLTLENMLRWGYRGRIFGINPRSEDKYVDGVRMVQQVEDLPEVPDLVYALIPAKFVPEMIERCGKLGVRHMAIPSGGFNEFDDQGQSLAELTLLKAREYNIRFVGPNGLTVANTYNGLCFPFAPLIKPPLGGISIISQSGGVGLMIINYLKDENLGMAKFASIGNKLDLNEVDFLNYLGTDPKTEIIFMYLESIINGRALIEAAQRIKKPIVIYKANTTDSGKKAAMSHTAAISNNDKVTQSAFEKAGILRIHDFSDFLAVAKAFQLPPLKGNRIMVMSPAGGVSVMMADLCEKAGFAFADPGQDFYKELQQFTNAGVIRFSNPLDMGDIYDPRFVTHVICSVMHSDQVDGAFYTSFTPQMPSGENVFRTLFRTDLSKEAWGAILSSGKPFAGCLVSPGLSHFKQTINVPIFNSPEELVRAMAMQMKYHAYQAKSHDDPKLPHDIQMNHAQSWLEKQSGDLGEETFELLNYYGIPSVSTQLAIDCDQAVSIAEKMGYPIVMKVASKDALHKSDAGGVIMDIKNKQEVISAFDSIRSNLERHNEKARFDGVNVQPMLSNGHDLFIGGKFDESFGPVIFFGLGGIFIELFNDTANLLCPASPEDIRSRFEMLKAFNLLNGLRGQATGDIDAFIDIVHRVSFVLHDYPRIQELDLNPIRVFKSGALVLDARMRLTNE